MSDAERIASLTADLEHWRSAALKMEHEIHDILAEALGYPLYEPGEPGYSPDRPNYVTGDHTAASLALEAAGKLRAQRDSGSVYIY